MLFWANHCYQSSTAEKGEECQENVLTKCKREQKKKKTTTNQAKINSQTLTTSLALENSLLTRLSRAIHRTGLFSLSPRQW